MEVAQRLNWVRRLAWASAALMLAITSLSAFIRLSAQASGAAAQLPQVLAAQVAHRITASTALVLIVAMVVLSHAHAPRLPRQGRLAGVMLVLALGLAVLGRATGSSRAPAVVAGNLAGGLALLACSWCLVRACASRAVGGPSGGSAWPAGSWMAFGMVLLSVVLAAWAGTGPGPAALHLGASILAALAALTVGVVAWQRPGVAGPAVVALTLLVLGTGWSLPGSPPGVGLPLLHNLLTGLLLSALAALSVER